MTYQHFIGKYTESIFGNSTHDRVTQKPSVCYGQDLGASVHFCKVLEKYDKLGLGLSLNLRLQAGDVLLTTYW